MTSLSLFTGVGDTGDESLVSVSCDSSTLLSLVANDESSVSVSGASYSLLSLVTNESSLSVASKLRSLL